MVRLPVDIDRQVGCHVSLFVSRVGLIACRLCKCVAVQTQGKRRGSGRRRERGDITHTHTQDLDARCVCVRADVAIDGAAPLLLLSRVQVSADLLAEQSEQRVQSLRDSLITDPRTQNHLSYVCDETKAAEL